MIDLSISAIAAFSANGIVYRAFGHLLAAGNGSLLAVPLAHAAGDLRRLVDGCPVPWEEAWSVIDCPPMRPVELLPDQVRARYARLASIATDGWAIDCIPPFAAGRPEVSRVTHVSGIRFAQV